MNIKGTILITDRDLVYLKELSHHLQEAGYEVRTADKVSGALALVQSEKIDVVILAADMPEMQGHEVVPIIKALAPRLPVIITAPENSQELEVKVRQASIFYYHVKSFGLEELDLAVQNALERSNR
jgi:two-component system, OmpR family, response regulator